MKKKLVAEEMPEFQKSIDEMPMSSKRTVDLHAMIAHKIFLRLEELGMSQIDLARKMFKTEPEVSKWVSGNQNFTIRTIAKIEEALNFELITVSWPFEYTPAQSKNER